MLYFPMGHILLYWENVVSNASVIHQKFSDVKKPAARAGFFYALSSSVFRCFWSIACLSVTLGGFVGSHCFFHQSRIVKMCLHVLEHV